MRAASRNRVQLTSLLDLLFIMIFIALLTTRISGNTQGAAGGLDLEYPDAIETLADGTSQPTGQIRKLFIANNHYRQGAGERYIETNLYAADDNQLWLYRINLVGAGLVQNHDAQPISADDPNKDGQQCQPLVITRQELQHRCAVFLPGGRQVERQHIVCRRNGAMSYLCREERRIATPAGEQPYAWDYRMELVEIFDEALR